MAVAPVASRKYVSYILGKSEFVVDERYKNLRPVGRGAYGLVASAEDSLTNRKVAIKRVSRVFQDLIDAKRILREIKLLRHLGRHDNIIEIMDIMTGPPDTEDFHTLYIVMQLYECDLERIISSPQKLTEQHAQYFVYQVLRGLKYIHSAKVLHRDLKPSNLLVNSNCDLAICDFGLARGISESGDTKLTEYVVTRWYRAPELLCESEIYGSPVDVWAVGCIFAEILGRRIMFKGASTREQLQIIIDKLGVPPADEMTGITNRIVIDTIHKMGAGKVPTPFAEQFPGASPMAIDLLSRMLTFDQIKRCTVDEALSHPYLWELHSRAREPVCPRAFDWSFERDYPDEMPQPLLQHHMYREMLAMRAEQGLLDATAPATIVMPAASRPADAAAMAFAAGAGAAPGAGGFPAGVGGAGAGAAAPMPGMGMGMGFPGAAPGAAVGGVGGVFGAPAGAPGMGMGPACGVDAATLAAAAAAAAAASAGMPMPAGAAGGAACLPTFGVHPAAAGPPGGAPMAM